MKVTLQVNGREMTFSEQELVAIVEEHFSRKDTEKVTTTKAVQKPTEGKWFDVRPQDINQELFQKQREDKKQEKTRKIILEAFAEVKKDPERYGKSFKTMIPKKEWSSNIGYKVEGQNANWIEQGLEWAQRIVNGESWEAICNNADTADWYRLVVGKHGCLKFIGGSRKKEDCSPASSIHSYIPDAGNGYFCYAVPLVVKY